MTENTHPSYGIISVSRVQSTGHHLVGSPYPSHSYIEITVNQSSRIVRDGGKEYFTPERPTIVQLNMSMAQWTELLCSMNYGMGVPCTIIGKEGKVVPRAPKQPTLEQRQNESYKKELQGHQQDIKKAEKEAFDMIDALTISNKKKQELKSLFGVINRNFVENTAFALQMFTEEAEKVVTAAKTEIASYAALNALDMQEFVPKVTSGRRSLPKGE